MLFPESQNVYGQGDGGTFDAGSENSWGARMDGQEVVDWTGKTAGSKPATG